jgi:hypothetical protein
MLFGLFDLEPVLRRGRTEQLRLVDAEHGRRQELIVEGHQVRRFRRLVADRVAAEVRLLLEVHGLRPGDGHSQDEEETK